MTQAQSGAHAFTIAGANFLPQALTLRRTWHAVHPEVPFTIVLIDRTSDDPLTVLTESASWDSFPRLRAAMPHLAAAFEVKEMATAVKPPVMLDLFDRGHDRVLYLDPDLWFVQRIPEAVDEPLAPVVLTPHVTQAFPDDGLRPNVWDILAAGVDNLGFASIGAEARPAVEWWAEHLRLWADRDVAQQRFTDQRPADMLAAFADTRVVRDTGWNVAYWNLHERPLREVDGVLIAGDAPLRFFHFSGFPATDPLRLSYQFQPGLRTSPLTPGSPVAALAQRYAEELAVSAAQIGGHPLHYGWHTLPNGAPFTIELLRLYRLSCQRSIHGLPTLPPPFASRAAADELVEWANDPHPDHPGATRFEVARREAGSINAAPTARPAPARTFGVHLVGFLDAANGLGEAARRLSASLTAAGVPVDHVVLPHPFARRTAGEWPRTSAAHTHVVLVVPPASTHPVLKDLPVRLRNARRVGMWFWEVDALPAEASDALAVVDEVWASSEFLYDLFAAAAPGRTRRMELPPRPTSRPALDGITQFVTIADLSSGALRKNVDGAVRAYLRAVPVPRPDVRLVAKVVGGDIHPGSLDAIGALVAGRDDIEVRHGYVSDAELAMLVAGSDCVLSLHRAEGLGLPVYDAVASGVPVIATGYGGTADVVPPGSPLAVPFQIVTVGPAARPYPAEAHWAEPDLDAAADRIAAFVADPAPFLTAARERAEDLAARTDAACGARCTALMQQPPDAPAGAPVTRILHFPKTAGTSLLHSYLAQRPDVELSRFRHDRAMFGSFDRFDELPAATRAAIAISHDELAELAAAPFVCGHVYLSTLLRSATPQQVVTVLREPRTRLLSLYSYWRSLSTAQREAWTPYDAFDRSAQPLVDFLADEVVAAETDNVYYRMSLGTIGAPHPGFLDPARTDEHAAAAIAQLESLRFVGVMEAPQQMWSGASAAFGCTMAAVHANATDLEAGTSSGALPIEITPTLLDRLHRRTAVDQRVHHHFLALVVGDEAATRIADATFLAQLQRLQLAAQQRHGEVLTAQLQRTTEHIHAIEHSRWWQLGVVPRRAVARARRLGRKHPA